MTSIYKHTTPGHRGSYALCDPLDVKNDQLKSFGWRKRRLTMKAGHEYLEATHTYQLTYGDQPFGKPQTMTGREAKQRNKQYEDKLFNALDKDPNARLWKLIWIKE